MQDSPQEEQKNTTETKKSEILDISSFSGKTAVLALTKSPENVSGIEDVESDVDQQIINLEEKHDGLDNQSSLNMSIGPKISKKLGN